MKDIAAWLSSHPAPARPLRVHPAGAAAPKGLAGMEISYSQICAYRDCPWRYKLIYQDRKRPPLHPRSSLGISIHAALEAYHRAGGGELEKLLDCYDEHWRHAGYGTAQEQLEWHRKGRRILERFHADENARRSEILAVEKELLAPMDPHALRGTIDRIDRRTDGSVEIIDYKTHLDVLDESQAAQSLQLGLYGLLAQDCLGLEVSWLTFYYVATGQRVSVPRDPSRDEELRALVVRTADLIVWGRGFPARAEHCPACDLRLFCARAVVPPEDSAPSVTHS